MREDKESCVSFMITDKEVSPSAIPLLSTTTQSSKILTESRTDPNFNHFAHLNQRHAFRTQIACNLDTTFFVDKHQMSNEQANVTKTKDSPLNRRLPCPGDLAAIPEVAEPVTEGFRLWQTEERDEESETSYKAGSATFIEIPVNGKPVMALLLSHQLGQWMLECVKLQRDHGELEGRSKGDIASIDKKIYDLQHISRSLNRQ